MLDLTIEGATFKIPESWEEVTLDQFNQMAEHADNLNPVRILAILTGLNYEELNNYDCSGFEVGVMPALGYLGDLPDFAKLERKSELDFGGRKVPTIADPGRERIGQKLYMSAILTPNGKTEKRIHEIAAQIVANYYAPKLHPENKWDENHVEIIRGEVLGMPVLDVMPEVNFFLIGFGYASTSKPKPTK